jgi:drug/metabolite transporter (DMT)-like permease
MNRVRKSYLLAGIAVFFWSTIPTAFKIGLGELDIMTLLTLAAFTSTIVLLIILITQKKWDLLLKSDRKELLLSAFLGLVNPFLYYIILLKAYELLPGQVAQPLNMIWPIILVFLSVPLLKQKIPGKSFIALLVSFAGVYVISSLGHPLRPGSANPIGILLATGSSFFWAFYFIYNVRDKRDEAVKLFTNFAFASIYLVLYALITGNIHPAVSLKGFAASVYIGLFEMGITFFLWLKALQTAETSDKISNLVYIAPFISILFLYFIIGEPVYYTTPMGLVLIISGIYLQNRKT